MLTQRRTSGGPLPFEAAYASPGDPPSKRKILEAALRLFASKGVHAVTVREIAAEAGYTNPALFKFFATKDALALHLFACCYWRLFERLDAAAGANASFGERLRAVLDVFFAQIEQDAEAFLFVQDHLREMWPRVSRQMRRKSILALIRSLLEQGVREGSVNAASNLDLLVAAVTGTLLQFARMLHFGEFEGRARDWAPEVEALVLRIVGS
jgi:AcrR family transcriptional regulator